MMGRGRNSPLAHCDHYLVNSLHKSQVALAIELVVLPGQPCGQGEGVVHEGVVEDGEDGGRGTQTQPERELMCVCVCVCRCDVIFRS